MNFQLNETEYFNQLNHDNKMIQKNNKQFSLLAVAVAIIGIVACVLIAVINNPN